MRTMVANVRTALFYLVFGLGSLVLVLIGLLDMALGGRFIARIGRIWSFFHRYSARILLGQRVVVEGDPPQTPCFYAIKHEAMFETLDVLCQLDNPVVVAKKELMNIPLWSRAAYGYGLVPIDRDAGASALRTLCRDARKALGAGRPFCFFPEGTRVPHGERPPLKAGFAGLYTLLGLPVVPVAVDSGQLNQRGQFACYPGVIRYRFGTPVPAGLPRAEAEARVHAAINALNS